MVEYRLHFPEDFDELEWEVEAKGWFGGVRLLVAGDIYELVIYDQSRLAQEIADDLAANPGFLEGNLLVVNRVARGEIESAVDYIVKTRKYLELKPSSGD